MTTPSGKPKILDGLTFSGTFLGFRSLGIAAPLSYFRSNEDWGVGDFDTLAHVVAFARETRQRIVQLLPLHLSISNNSPYSIASMYVMDPVYIGMRTLQRQLHPQGFRRAKAYSRTSQILISLGPSIAQQHGQEQASFEDTRRLKYQALRILAQEFYSEELGRQPRKLADALIGNDAIENLDGTENGKRFLDFCAQNRYWLADHLLYFHLREKFHSDDFRQWPTAIAIREPNALRREKNRYQDAILFDAFLQWVLSEQLALRYRDACATLPRVEIMLDQPFAFGNADVWTHPDAFQLSPATMKREFTQGVPPHRLDIPQHWQFTLLRTNSAAKHLLMDRLQFLLQFCTLLRIDHLLGYYRLFYMSEDTAWEMTLENLGIWVEIDTIFHGEAPLWEKRSRIFDIILHALKKSLPPDAAGLVFHPNGDLRKTSTLLAARRDFPKEVIDRDTTGWYRQYSVEHGQDLLYMLLNPNTLGDRDYLETGMQRAEYFLRPSDSIRACFFQPGFGEEIISAFLATAQTAGKTLVVENLGEVPPLVERSLQELGMPQFKPLYFGYQKFIGDPNDYWVEKITPLDCACFGYHDTVTLKGWWTGDGLWSARKNYFQTDDQKQAVVDWLRAHGYLKPGESVSLTELGPALHDAVLASVSDSPAGMVVFQMPDLFGSGDEGIINIPGQLGFWTTRAPVSMESLLQAAQSETGGDGSSLAADTVARMRWLSTFRERDTLYHSDYPCSTEPPRFLATHPRTGPGAKQIAFFGDSFHVDVVVCGQCNQAEIILENGARISMDRLAGGENSKEPAHVFRCTIPVTEAWLGTHSFRICLDNQSWSESGYLVGLSAGTNSNPLSEAHGQVAPLASDSVWPRQRPLEFLQTLLESLMPWIQQQHWFLGKAGRIVCIEAMDGFQWASENAAADTIGLLARVSIQASKTREAHLYYLPLHVCSSASQAASFGLPFTACEVGGRYVFIIPAEHSLAYQRILLRNFAEQSRLNTAAGNRLVFQRASEQTGILRGEIRTARNLLADPGDMSSNILTDIGMEKQSYVVKTFKRGADDIESEVYSALWRQHYPHILDGLGDVSLERQDGARIPLCLVLKKLVSPPGLSRQQSTAGFQAYKIFSESLRRWIGSGAPGMEDPFLAAVFEMPTDACCDVRAMIRELGEVLASLHIGLASSAEAGFGVHAATSADLDKFFRADLQQGLREMEANIRTLSKPEYDLLRKSLPALRQALARETSRWRKSSPAINFSRAHGDMQLEQIMLDAEYRWIIIDLGGAPLLSAEERRKKTCVFADVAGVLRAFGYIKFAALETELRLERDILMQAVYGDTLPRGGLGSVRSAIAFATLLEQKFSNLFVESYLAALESRDATGLFLPAWDRDLAHRLIAHCLTLRALYEMRYEISARPAGHRILIPFESLFRLATPQPRTDAGSGL